MELGASTIFILYLVNELVSNLRLLHNDYHGERKEESIVLACLFVFLPTIIYFIYLIKFLRAQILSKAFYHSHHLFYILSCGTKSLNEYAAQKVHDYEEAFKSGRS